MGVRRLGTQVGFSWPTCPSHAAGLEPRATERLCQAPGTRPLPSELPPQPRPPCSPASPCLRSSRLCLPRGLSPAGSLVALPSWFWRLALVRVGMMFFVTTSVLNRSRVPGSQFVPDSLQPLGFVVCGKASPTLRCRHTARCHRFMVCPHVSDILVSHARPGVTHGPAPMLAGTRAAPPSSHLSTCWRTGDEHTVLVMTRHVLV